MPAATALSSIGPEMRVSRPMKMRLPGLPNFTATARPKATASSGVSGATLAQPRMPSVPKSRESAPMLSFLFLASASYWPPVAETSSISKTSVAFGGMASPAPCMP